MVANTDEPGGPEAEARRNRQTDNTNQKAQLSRVGRDNRPDEFDSTLHAMTSEAAAIMPYQRNMRS